MLRIVAFGVRAVKWTSAGKQAELLLEKALLRTTNTQTGSAESA